jgi:hypothetical protein
MFGEEIAVRPAIGPAIVINVLAFEGAPSGAPVVVVLAAAAALIVFWIVPAFDVLAVAPVPAVRLVNPVATLNIPAVFAVTAVVMSGAIAVFREMSGVPNSAVAEPPTKPFMSA